MGKRRERKAHDKITHVQALTASAFAAMLTQFPPPWVHDYLSAVEKQALGDEPLRAAERKALEQALASCRKLFDVMAVPYQPGDEVVVTGLAAQGLAFLHAHVLASPPDSDLLV